MAFPAIINRSGDAFVLQYNILFKRRVALYINFWLLCLEIIPSEETVAGFQWYITQGVNLLLTKVDIEFSIL